MVGVECVRFNKLFLTFCGLEHFQKTKHGELHPPPAKLHLPNHSSCLNYHKRLSLQPSNIYS